MAGHRQDDHRPDDVVAGIGGSTDQGVRADLDRNGERGGDVVAERAQGQHQEQAVDAIEQDRDPGEQLLDHLAAEGYEDGDAQHQGQHAGEPGRAEHRVTDLARRRAEHGQHHDDEEGVGQFEGDPASTQQGLEEAAIIPRPVRPREQEGQDAHAAPDQRRQGQAGEAARRSGGQEELGDLAARGVAPADDGGLEGQSREQPAAEPTRRLAAHARPLMRGRRPAGARTPARRAEGRRSADPGARLSPRFRPGPPRATACRC